MTTDLPEKYVDSQLDDVSRSVDARPADGRVAITLELSQEYPTDAADLWDAVTTANRLERWFAPVHGDLRVGGSYQVEGNAGGVVQTCEPPFRFTATWVMGEPPSLIDVRIEPVDEGRSRLRLIHTGDIESGFWETYGPGAVGVGWDLSLLGLALHISTGAGRPPEVEAWGASDQAREFMTGSSDRWVAAAVTGGTPADAARAAGDRTTAFYTGQPA